MCVCVYWVFDLVCEHRDLSYLLERRSTFKIKRLCNLCEPECVLPLTLESRLATRSPKSVLRSLVLCQVYVDLHSAVSAGDVVVLQRARRGRHANLVSNGRRIVLVPDQNQWGFYVESQHCTLALIDSQFLLIHVKPTHNAFFRNYPMMFSIHRS